MPNAERDQEGWTAYVAALGQNMMRSRIERGMSQEDVAYAAGLSRYTYQKFEKGESRPGHPANPSMRNVLAIAQALEVDIDRLLPDSKPDLLGR
jgi:transcriptional regulator with XRE-family HTH domain